MKKQRKGPFVLGLTGSIASGKSTALEAFSRMGAYTLSADEFVREELARPVMQKKLKKEFGVCDAPSLAKQVFKKPVLRKRLEGMLHPAVLKKARAAIRRSGAELAVFEVPLLFEAGWDKYVDMTLLIYAGQQGLASRLKARGLSRGEYESRLKTQMEQDQKARLADLIIVNQGTKKDLQQKVYRLAGALKHIYK